MTRLVNNVKTVVLLGAIMGLALAIGSIWGTRGLIFGFIFGGVSNLIAYFFSDRIALAAMGAVPVSKEEAPELHRMVEELAQGAGIPKPRVYVAPQQAPNAFATGRSPRHAAVCVTEGLLRLLPPREVRAVLAHEIGHVRHWDTLISSIAATIAGAISALAYLAWFIPVGSDDERGGNPLVAMLLLILAPIIAVIIQFAISRSREYVADAYGGQLHGDPRDLARALERLEEYARGIRLRCPEAYASLFVVNPLAGGGVTELFSSHPPTPKRIERLLAQARAMGLSW